MTYSQQNNSVSVSNVIRVNFLNVTYVNIIEDSNIHKLISRLVVAQKEFQKSVDWKLPVSEIKSKALESSSILEALMDSTSEVAYDKRKALSEKIINSCCVVLKQYQDALDTDGFEENILNELRVYTQNFFEDNFGRKLDSEFWFNLKCYEWLLKEEFIKKPYSSYINSDYSFIFDEKILEEFFISNRNEVIKLILKHKTDNDCLTFSSPLDNTETNQSYSLFCQISEFTQA